MNGIARLLTIAALLALILVPHWAWAQPFDNSISFSFADDDILRDPGETRRNSPAAYIGGQASNATDRIDGSVFGQSYSRLTLHKKLRTGDLYPEGKLAMRLAPGNQGTYTLADEGTFLSLNYRPDEELGIYLQMYPVDSDRFRLGRHYDISWGGTSTFPKNFTTGLVPGVKLGFELGAENKLSGFAGLKTALVRSPAEGILDNPGGNTNQFVERTYYGFLGGLGLDLAFGLSAAVEGGSFTKGTSTRPNVLGSPLHAGGGNVTLAYHLGGVVGKRLDLRMYYEDPDRNPIAGPEDYASDFGFDIAIEGALLVQTLEDPDRYGSTTNEYSKAFQLSSGVRWRSLRVHFDTVYRDLTYVVWNVPGFVPNQALPDNADLSKSGPFSFLPEALSGEWFGVLSADYFLQFAGSMGLTPAITVGLLLPATYMSTQEGITTQGPFPAAQSEGLQKTVVRGSSSGDWNTLRPGDDEMPVLLVKFDLRYNLSRNFSIIGELSYANDANYSQVEIDPQGHAQREYLEESHIIGLGVVSELAF